jgi:selenocysteine-specific elongation factor
MGSTPSATKRPPLTLGTAGHIDHGKTALISVLTGVNTDRLPEERSRGISIDLGYANLPLPSGATLSVVDVPGHERFVRTMVAGATGIDLFLMVVAADDGLMPQTLEHAAVLGALGVDRGVVAVTKSDLADPELALAEVAELMPGVPAVPVSSRTGLGIEELRAHLDAVAAQLPGRAVAAGGIRLHVDRSFTIKGAGTVVTGTLWSGEATRGAELAILPAGRRARVRSVQVHDVGVEVARAGQRVALNLVGVRRDEVARGDVVASADAALAATYRIDVALEWSAEAARPAHGDRVQVHHGTREAPARLAELGGRFWQLRLEQPLVPARGDRVVIRSIAPPDTLGGGTVLDPAPRRHGPSRDVLARLARLERGEEDEEEAGGGRSAGRRGWNAARGGSGERAGSEVAGSGESTAAAADAPPALSPDALRLEALLREAGFEPPIESELGDLAAELAGLRAAGRAVRVGRSLHYHREALAEIERRVVELCEREGQATIAGLRDELGTSRKFAQALLEHFDGEKLTRRVGDAHVLRGRGRPA